MYTNYDFYPLPIPPRFSPYPQAHNFTSFLGEERQGEKYDKKYDKKKNYDKVKKNLNREKQTKNRAKENTREALLEAEAHTSLCPANQYKAESETT